MSVHSLYVGIFYLSGEPISLHLLRCGPFAVDYHSFMGQRLASTTTSTRELSRLISYYDKEFSIICDFLDKGDDLLKSQGIFFL
jgi:hypothetical protein